MYRSNLKKNMYLYHTCTSYKAALSTNISKQKCQRTEIIEPSSSFIFAWLRRWAMVTKLLDHFMKLILHTYYMTTTPILSYVSFSWCTSHQKQNDEIRLTMVACCIFLKIHAPPSNLSPYYNLNLTPTPIPPTNMSPFYSKI